MIIITVLSPCKASLSNAECDNSRHNKVSYSLWFFLFYDLWVGCGSGVFCLLLIKQYFDRLLSHLNLHYILYVFRTIYTI